MGIAPTSLDLETEVRELFEAKLREFIAFCAQHWTLTDQDLAGDFSDKSPEYQNGYNAALTDGLDGALSCWLEEHYA